MKHLLHFFKRITPMLALAVLMMAPSWGWGQINITAGGAPVTQDFAIGITATATLPTGWKVDKNSGTRLVGNWNNAVNKTELVPTNPPSAFTANGIYNFFSGTTTASTERSVGWLASNSATTSGNLYVYLNNNGSSSITNFSISYNVEKYRNGSNAAGFRIQMYYSTNGTSWTSAGPDFLTSFAADVNNSSFSPFPISTTSVTAKTLALTVAAGTPIYLAWNYSVTTGSTTSNAQALGIDDVSITAIGVAANDNDSEVFEGTQPAASNLSSLVDTDDDAISVFSMVIEDQGTSDGKPTRVTKIRLKPHTTNNADWTNTIQGVFVDDGTNFLYPTVTITDTYIDLVFTSTALVIPDGSSLEVTLWLYLNTSNIVDGSILSFMVDAEDHGFTADPTGSSFASSFLLGDFNSNDFTLSVEGTKLTFKQQPSNVILDLQMTPAVTVAFTDANGNVDIDYDGEGFGISLTSTGTFSASATTAVDAVNGVSTFNNIKYSAIGTGITITASDEDGWGNTSATSNVFNVSNLPMQEAGILLFEENFDYTGLLTANGYTVLSGDGTNNLTSGTIGLSYANYGSSGIGNALSVANNGQDVYKTFTKQNSPATVYASFLLNISEAKTGDYVFAFGPSAGASNFRGRLFIKGSATSGYLNFGISNGNTGTTYGSTDFALNTTHLVVIKYEFTSGSTATATVFINPNLFAQPATYEVSVTDNTAGNAPADITHYAIRQGNAASAPTFVMDGIRIATDWGACLGNPQYDAASNIAAGNYNDVSVSSNTLSLIGNVAINGTAANNGNISVGANTLAINGAISGSGVYTGGATSNISVGGTGANLTFPNVVNGLNNLTITRPNGISIGSTKSLTIAGTLTNSVGNAGLVIENGGSLIHSSSNVPATVKRAIPGTAEAWHLLSSPVANQSITGNFIPSGTYTGGFGYDFYAWDEPSVMWLNQKDGTNGITQFVSGKGYLVAYQVPDTKTFVGNLNAGTVPFTLKYEGTGDYKGSNLIGNPYASGIDWNLADRSKFADVFAYVYNAAKDGGEGYITVDGSAIGAYIGVNQGFMVLAKSDQNDATFNFTNAMRAHGGSYLKNANAIDLLKVRFANANNYDETSIRLSGESDFTRDRNDAVKMFSYNPAIPQVYTLTSDLVSASINTIPSISEEAAFQLCLYVPAQDNYVISLPAAEGEFAGRTVYLEDKLTGSLVNLSDIQTYVFAASPSDNVNRFVLKFGTLGIDKPTATSGVQAYAYGDVLYVSTSGKEAALVNVYNLTGQLVMQGKTGGNTLSTFNASSLVNGVYMVSVILNKGVVSQKVIIRK